VFKKKKIYSTAGNEYAGRVGDGGGEVTTTASITRGRIEDDTRRHGKACLGMNDEEGYEDEKIG
jgi:hypothetical protein